MLIYFCFVFVVYKVFVVSGIVVFKSYFCEFVVVFCGFNMLVVL